MNNSGDDNLLLGKLVDTLKLCDDFDDLPGDSDLAPRCYNMPCQPNSVTPSTEADKENMRYEEYLRAKWQCSEAMPAPFDSEKLESVRKSRFGATGSKGGSKQVDKAPLSLDEVDTENHENALEEHLLMEDTDPHYEDVSAVSISGRLGTEDRLKNYESDGTAEDRSENITRVKPRANSTRRVNNSTSKPTGQERIPRIKTGSKPPLSRSAFAKGGEPRTEETGSGASPIVYPRAPKYFPYQKRSGRK